MASHDEIFLALGGIAPEEPLVEAADAVATAMDYHVRSVFLGADDAAALMMSSDGVTGLGLGAVEALSTERATARDRAAAMTADRERFRHCVHAGSRAQATGLSRLAPFAMVDAHTACSTGPLADVFQTLLMEDGAAVVVARGPLPAKRIGLAWDGSREAARALKMARDFVRLAEHVTIFQAKTGLNPKDAACAPPQFASEWIARRETGVDTIMVESKGAPGDELLQAAANAGVELLIAGAYGHARFREAVFGGVTRALLAAKSPSLFLAH